jgi:hypothetical protein
VRRERGKHALPKDLGPADITQNLHKLIKYFETFSNTPT